MDSTILDQTSNKTSPARKRWLFYSLMTIILWGVWGAIIALPEENGLPAELGFIMWAVAMIVPALVALKRIGWKLDLSFAAVTYGSVIGLLGGAGQLVLYSGAIANGPAYLIFPIIALSPVVTIVMSLALLRERVSIKGALGILLAIIAVPFLNYSEQGNNVVDSSGWLFFALTVFLAWGIQGYYLKVANNHVSAESLFFYMMATSLIISPIAWIMTDNPVSANWGWNGAGLAFAIGLLNAFGALTLVYAFRYGKAIIVSPMVNCLPPIITSILSLIILSVIPSMAVAVGMGIALVSSFLLALSEET